MGNQEFSLPSGAKLNVTVAPFADASALLKAILRSVKGMALSTETLQMELGELRNPAVFSQILDKILSVAVSDEVEEKLFRCFERSVYDGVKVTKALFDDINLGERAREDYYTICMKVIEVNCSPFFKTAFSGLKTPQKTLVTARA